MRNACNTSKVDTTSQTTGRAAFPVDSFTDSHGYRWRVASRFVNIVRERIAPQGLVHVDGAVWSATSEEGPLEPGETIVVIEELPHMRLRVKRLE